MKNLTKETILSTIVIVLFVLLTYIYISGYGFPREEDFTPQASSIIFLKSDFSLVEETPDYYKLERFTNP